MNHWVSLKGTLKMKIEDCSLQNWLATYKILNDRLITYKILNDKTENDAVNDKL